eukprot:46096-Amphidinium_carterae.1
MDTHKTGGQKMTHAIHKQKPFLLYMLDSSKLAACLVSENINPNCEQLSGRYCKLFVELLLPGVLAQPDLLGNALESCR